MSSSTDSMTHTRERCVYVVSIARAIQRASLGGRQMGVAAPYRSGAPPSLATRSPLSTHRTHRTHSKNAGCSLLEKEPPQFLKKKTIFTKMKSNYTPSCHDDEYVKCTLRCVTKWQWFFRYRLTRRNQLIATRAHCDEHALHTLHTHAHTHTAKCRLATHTRVRLADDEGQHEKGLRVMD